MQGLSLRAWCKRKESCEFIHVLESCKVNRDERFMAQVRKEVNEFLSDSGNMGHGGLEPGLSPQNGSHDLTKCFMI